VASFFATIFTKFLHQIFAMPTDSPDNSLSRRCFLQGALAAASATALPAGAQGQGLAYEVSNWSGPIAGFALADSTGKTWRLTDLGGRAVLLNFWASWCEPCRAEMPTLQQVADLYGPDKLLVLAINFKEPAARALKFAASTGLSLPILLDADGQAARRWGVKVFPTTLLLDRRGRPRQRVQGEVDWTGSAAEQLIAGLLKA
jgi:thiol-disulfide isomerase/thioredoxin